MVSHLVQVGEGATTVNLTECKGTGLGFQIDYRGG
ncbi:Hypothetical protein I1A_000011 (plasmid) [Pseudomonas fluorescens R124]|uniref:Uncharacterized protein n=1 Tax=Pseudomonas fluorescens R124 TaxID=743713 RepID=K0WNF5_PSEFL|nr:hypothetical protein I1A_000011 [Pseudomonas fluorescens R124]EJZ60932.1 Hypothetical protein I1A_000011 [Pseudomonas fluorescens R124]